VVARADLAQLDAGEERGQVTHQRAEIDPLLGVEIEREAAAVVGILGLRQLHRQFMLLDALGTTSQRLFLFCLERQHLA